VGVEKRTKAVISVNFSPSANEDSITYERSSSLKRPEKSFSTATPDYNNAFQLPPPSPVEVVNIGQTDVQLRAYSAYS
jgi:hypothetical protein